MYGYFYINIYKNPNHKIIKNKLLVDYYLNLKDIEIVTPKEKETN